MKKNNAWRKFHMVIAMVIAVAAAAFTVQSCDNDNDYYDVICAYPPQPNAIVTVKTAADNAVYLQLDDSTTLYPVNMQRHPFGGKEVRAFVDIRSSRENHSGYTRSVFVAMIDSVLTKPAVPTLGDRNSEVYGDDPLNVLDGFPTVCEDNYLTLCISTVWGRPAKKHLVNLVTGVNPDDPYEVELRQNSYGDTTGNTASTTVAFSLKSLPKTGGKTVKLKLRYRSFDGEKTKEFDYKTAD